MKIGLRTIKTAIAATLAIVVAYQLNLLYPTAAGIIAVLSVTNTKKSSLKTGASRLVALTVATIVAAICFLLIGYRPIAFGIYLLFFIPLAVKFKLSDGIVVSSVLVTHYLIEESLALSLILNEYALMILGVGFALIMNLYMPNLESELQEEQEEIEGTFREILTEMGNYLNGGALLQPLTDSCDKLLTKLRVGELKASYYQENKLFSQNLYYRDYFSMRRSQTRILADMLDSLQRIEVDAEHVEKIRSLLVYTAETFEENNDGQEILERIYVVYEDYRQMPLPQSREEFENRAELFQFLQSFKTFIEIKAEFAELQNTML